MRIIGHLESEFAARRLGDFLYVQGITNTVERDDNTWVIWVHEDDQLKAALDWLEKFRQNPSDPQFDRATKADQKRQEEKKDHVEYQKRFKTRREVFRTLTAYGLGKLTVLLIAISVAVAILSGLGDNINALSSLMIVNISTEGGYHTWMPGLQEVLHGEVWRLFTPMFIHFSIAHILFNMWTLRDFGSMVEGREGSLRLLLLVLIIAALSNLAQYGMMVFQHPKYPPLFGGMSGVLYGLLGYIWMKGKFDPASGLFLHKDTVTMMLVWLVLCFVGIIPHVANTAHISGLLVGMGLGVLLSMRPFRKV